MTNNNITTFIQQSLFIIMFVGSNIGHKQTTAQTTTKTKQKCKEEINSVCPKAQYSTLKDRKNCFAINFMVLSPECQPNMNNKTSNTTTNNQQNSKQQNIFDVCYDDAVRFCETKHINDKLVPKHKYKCQKTLKQHKDQVLSPECFKLLSSTKNPLSDERRQQRNQRKIKQIQTRATFGSVVIQTPTGNVKGYILPTQIPPQYHQNTTSSKRQQNKGNPTTNMQNTTNSTPQSNTNIKIPDLSDRLEFEDNGSETGGTTILSNGRAVRQSQLDRFYKKYSDYLDTMSEEGENQILNKYFPNTQVEITTSENDEN